MHTFDAVTFRHEVQSTMSVLTSSKPHVAIRFEGEGEPGYQAPDFYTTLDELRGEVEIKLPEGKKFDNIQISLEGATRSIVEKMSGSTATFGGSGSMAIRNTVSKTFLKLVQPIDPATLPVEGSEHERGGMRTFTFPFQFTVPASLVLSTCHHTVGTPAVTDSHLTLPPSLGDAAPIPGGGGYKDDQCPDAAKVLYAIRVRLYRDHNAKSDTIHDSARRIQVLPAIPDQPPLAISGDEFTLSKSKDLRKSLLTGGRKLGKLTVSTVEPKPLQLNPKCPYPSHTAVTLNLTYVPVEPDSQPPMLGCLTARLKSSTFYSLQAMITLPNHSTKPIPGALGKFTDNVLLSARCMSATRWTRTADRKPEYRAQIVIPVAPPRCRTLVPTFSTCFVARAYALSLSISVQNMMMDMTLKIPLQVSHPGTSWDSPPGEEVDLFAMATMVADLEIPAEGRSGRPRPPAYSVLGAPPLGVGMRRLSATAG